MIRFKLSAKTLYFIIDNHIAVNCPLLPTNKAYGSLYKKCGARIYISLFLLSYKTTNFYPFLYLDYKDSHDKF